MRILGIETSADDTGVALIDANGNIGVDFTCTVRANVVRTQRIHRDYGGIFPNKAKEEHAKDLPKLYDQALKKAKVSISSLDAVAVTVGPGLEPCLWTGITFAQKISKENGIPIIPVNHMEGHIVISLMNFSKSRKHSNILENVRMSSRGGKIAFPFLALLVSGGHTELILSRAWMRYEYLGRTRDDAVGEAFDKVARMLGLGYPGGPAIARLAAASRSVQPTDVRHRMSHVALPRPMINSGDYDFSFAGLKTAAMRLVEQSELISGDYKSHIAREFEDAAVEVLVAKTLRAAEEHSVRTIVVGGGVSANSHLRAELSRQLSTVNCQLLLPPPHFSTDNALMIALAGYFRALRGEFANAPPKADGRLRLA